MKTLNINMKNHGLGTARSVIRETFEYGNKRAAIVGRENVYDFSLGNPSVPAPLCVDKKIAELASSNADVHGYTSAQGLASVRKSIADNLNKRFGVDVNADDLYMTCGAAASLTVSLNAICLDGDEVIAIAPYFPEYKVFVEGAGAKLVTVEADLEAFQINFDLFESAVNEKTKAVIINSPNNPSGAVFTEQTILRLAEILKERSEQYGHSIYLISDEPYRELVYDNSVKVPFLLNYYDDTIVCYSYSKSMSLPGERIGYILVSNKMHCNRDVYAAVCGAGRALGFVCAPALMQYVIDSAPDAVSDISEYKKNRDLLYDALTSYGYECVHPDGAFYLFVKSPLSDAVEFCEKAKELDLLLVPSDSFGVKGYMRISYCVSNDMIRRSLPLFEKLIKSVQE